MKQTNISENESKKTEMNVQVEKKLKYIVLKQLKYLNLWKCLPFASQREYY